MVGRPFEDAVQTYRRECAGNHWGSTVPEWGIPSLFLAVADSALFATATSDPYPLNFRPLIRRHVPIVGRRFVFERLETRLKREIGGVFLLTAEPGLAKTAFAAQWVQEHPGTAHYFFSNREGRTDPTQCLRSIYAALLGRYGVLRTEADNALPMDLRERFNKFLADTVAPRCANEGEHEVIVIDALDEAAETSEGKVLDLLPRELPPRVHLLLTARPTKKALALGRESGVEHLHIAGTGADNLNDATTYAMREFRGRIAADPATFSAATRSLAEQVGGNFLVLHQFLSSGSLAGATTLAKVMARAERLTPCMEDLYGEFLDRVLARTGHGLAEREVLEEVLGALATAAAPVTRAQVCAAFNLRPALWNWAIELLDQFLVVGMVRDLPGDATAYALYHETFQEFLRTRYESDLPRLEGCWANHCERWHDLQGYARLYAKRHLPRYLHATGRRDELGVALRDYGYSATGFAVGSGALNLAAPGERGARRPSRSGS